MNSDECTKKDSPKKVIYVKSCFIIIVACGECMLFSDWLPEDWFLLANSFSSNNTTMGLTKKMNISGNNAVYPISVIINGISLIFFGSMYDASNIFRLRMLSILLYLSSTLLITFTTPEMNILVYFGFSMLCCCSDALFLCNLTLGNLFSNHRNLVFMVLVSCRHFGSILIYAIADNTKFVPVTYRYGGGTGRGGGGAGGINVQTCFMFLTGGMVPLLVISIAIYARRTHSDWPPDLYGQTNYESSYSIASYLQRRRLCEPENNEEERNKRKLRYVITSRLYLIQVVWYVTLTYLFNVDHYSTTPKDVGEMKLLTMHGITLAISIVIGVILDTKYYANSNNDTMIKTITMIKMASCGIIVTTATTMTMIFSCFYGNRYFVTTTTSIISESLLSSTCIVLIANIHPYENFGRLLALQLSVTKIVELFQYSIYVVLSDGVLYYVTKTVQVLAILVSVVFVTQLLCQRKTHKFLVPAYNITPRPEGDEDLNFIQRNASIDNRNANS